MRSRNPGANRSTWRVTSSVGSSVESAGTWMYAHSTCLAVRRPRRVEHRRLHREHVGPIGHALRARRRSRSPRPRRGCRRGARSGSGRRRGAPTGSARRARSRPSPPRGRSGSAGSPARTPAGMSGWVSTQPRRGVEQQQVAGIRIAPVEVASEVTRVLASRPRRRARADRRRARRRCAARRRAGTPSRRRRARARRGRVRMPPPRPTEAGCWRARARP